MWVRSFFAPLLPLLALAGLLMPLEALAQATPRVLVIFDTSGSMLWDYEGGLDCYGDGSGRYPHRAACGLGSRMFHAKDALSAIINDSPDFEFGLMRYGQLEPGDAGFGDRQTAVGAQYRSEDRTIQQSNYDGASNACGPADMLVDPGPMSRPQVLRWMDGSESYPNDKELRGNGYTPLTDSMLSARAELTRLISNDVESECRPYYVLLLTDGYQQCPDADASDPGVRNQVAIELALTTGSMRALNVQGIRKDVRTFVVGFGPGTAFATELDTMARAGGTAINANGDPDPFFGNAYQANNPRGLAAALGDAIGNAQPVELCDGLDNDCDGRVDEDFPNLGSPCREGIGACGRAGVIICADDGTATCTAEPGDPRDEVCDNDDNDCDGQVDEGLLNGCGGCGDLPVELCNGLDEDCDGAVDEGALNRCGECGGEPDEGCDGADNDCDGRIDEGAQNACGECGVVPVEVCDCDDNDCDNSIDEGMECPRCNCDASPEICDGEDNDCDNRIDEGALNACGECGVVPVEVCNGLDEDCDGRIDEMIAEVGEPCGDALGQCQAGRLVCRGGSLECDGEVQAESEICDTLDNDCDGIADEGAYNGCGRCGAERDEICDNIDNDCDGQRDGERLCPDDTDACVNGECAPPCAMGECFDNRVCVDGFCLEPCRNADCPSGWVCRDAVCHDPCAGIDCPSGRYCTLGQCVELDCYGGACPSGQLCREGDCEPDPCATADCSPGQGCADGRCFDDCSTITCPTGQICANGECIVDECARTNCGYPRVCVEGECVDDPCGDVVCPVGRSCDDGLCVDDPCIGVVCPNGAVCRQGRCPGIGRQTDPGGANEPEVQPPMLPDAPPASDDCACDVDGNGPSNWWLMLPALVLGLRRRR